MNIKLLTIVNHKLPFKYFFTKCFFLFDFSISFSIFDFSMNFKPLVPMV